ncbi:ABC transporter permease [Nocardiopsis rhodophaea]|uniref:ABC transporter permease n=1 Tax=Nocardiopsis rhodophaea TaxID=280238 RepID=A0ABP5EYY2_9ACTN
MPVEPSPSPPRATTENASPGAEEAAADAGDRRVQGLDALELGPDPAETERGAAVLAFRLWSAAWPKLLAVAVVLIAWQAVVWIGWKPVYVLPGPDRVLGTLLEELKSGAFWEAVRTTMERAVAGFALAFAVGGTVGLLISRFKVLRNALGSLITGLQTMPSIVWFPFAMLLYGISEAAIMFVVVLGAAPSIANGLANGADYVPPTLRRAGQVMGLRGISLYRFLIVPASLPMFVSGLKQGWAFAWRSLMAGELLVIINQQHSIGWALSQSRAMNDADRLLAYIFVVLAIGILIDIVFSRADASIRTRWGLNTS